MHKKIPKPIKDAARSALIGLVNEGARAGFEQIKDELAGDGERAELDELRQALVVSQARLLVEGPDLAERGDGLNAIMRDDARAALEHALDSDRLIENREARARAKAVVMVAIDGAFKVAKVSASTYLSAALGVRV